MTRPERRRRLLVLLCGISLVGGLAYAAGLPAVVGSGVQSLFGSGHPADLPAPTNAPVRPPADNDAGGVASTDPESARAQTALVAAEDDRITAVTSAANTPATPYVVPAGPGALPTAVLPARARPYDAESLIQARAAERQPDGALLIRSSVLVDKGAQLRIEAPGGVVRLASGPAGFASIVVYKGALTLLGSATAPLTVTSWTGTGPDAELRDGRAYVRAIGGRMDLTGVTVSQLGFWSGRTGGLAWTGSLSGPSTGSATATTVSGGHYGIFASRTKDLVLVDTTLRDNDFDGLLVHHDTTGLRARHVTSVDNGRDGIAVVSGAQQVTVAESTVQRNAGDGIRIDGSPVSDDATAAGASAARATDFTVEQSMVGDNAEGGITVTSADDVRLQGNTVAGAFDGISVRGPAAAVEIAGNTVTSARYAVAVRAAVTGANVHDNVIPASTVGIRLTDSVGQLRTNTMTASRYGVSLVGEVSGSAVVDNHLRGEGRAAVDIGRIAVAATADVSGNDDSEWVVDRDELRDLAHYVRDHPLVLLWGLILVLLVLARIGTVRWRRQRRAGAHSHRKAASDSTASDSTATDSTATDKSASDNLAETAPMPVLSGRRRRGGAVGMSVDSPTAALPVTRVTVVSGAGAKR